MARRHGAGRRGGWRSRRRQAGRRAASPASPTAPRRLPATAWHCGERCAGRVRPRNAVMLPGCRAPSQRGRRVRGQPAAPQSPTAHLRRQPEPPAAAARPPLASGEPSPCRAQPSALPHAPRAVLQARQQLWCDAECWEQGATRWAKQTQLLRALCWRPACEGRGSTSPPPHAPCHHAPQCWAGSARCSGHQHSGIGTAGALRRRWRCCPLPQGGADARGGWAAVGRGAGPGHDAPGPCCRR